MMKLVKGTIQEKTTQIELYFNKKVFLWLYRTFGILSVLIDRELAP
jgi:hypothetical protein